MREGGKFACLLAIVRSEDGIPGDVYALCSAARERDGSYHVYILSGFCF
jgi:hypothetical protein